MRAAAPEVGAAGRDEGLSVIIPTWNSGSRLGRSLDTVERNLRPSKVIVVDRDSEDETQDIARQYGAVVLRDATSLGSARMKGVRESETEWIAFVDDDISIPPGFKEELFRQVREDVGAVQGAVRSVHVPQRDLLTASYEKRFAGDDHFDLRPGERGLTSATIIRRDLVKDLKLEDMNTWEDWIITQNVLSAGLRWVVARPYVDHFHPYEDLAYKEGWNAAGILNLGRTGRMSKKRALQWYLDTVLEALRQLRWTGDAGELMFRIRILGHVLMAPRHLIGVVPRRPRSARVL